MTTDGATGARRPLAPPAFSGKLTAATPSPKLGEGWGGGSRASVPDSLRSLPPPYPPPLRGRRSATSRTFPSRIRVPPSHACPYRIRNFGGFIPPPARIVHKPGEDPMK